VDGPRPTVAAGAKSGDHHHGEAETAIYVVSGTPGLRLRRRDDEVRLVAGPGDYIFVPPYVPHREENPGDEEAVFVIARSRPGGHRVNLESLWPALPGPVRLTSGRGGEGPRPCC